MDDKKNISNDVSPETIQLLRELFSGKILGDLAINHQDTMEAIGALQTHLDQQRSEHVSFGSFLYQLSDVFKVLESPAIRSYGEQIRDMELHKLEPAQNALAAIAQTFAEAEANAQERDPELRKAIARKLHNVPAGIRFILDELDIIATEFTELPERCRKEMQHLTHLHGERLPESYHEEMDSLEKHIHKIQELFSGLRMPIHHFRSEHVRISNRAQRLEKEFMSPPRGEAALGIA